MTEKTIGEKLTDLRNERSITQRELGKIIGVSTASIAMYETNERVPRDEVKRKIAEYFNRSVQEIFF